VAGVDEVAASLGEVAAGAEEELVGARAPESPTNGVGEP
jgi:hypothetical protein